MGVIDIIPISFNFGGVVGMKNFTDELVDIIIQGETPRLDAIMQDVAKKIQGDMVAVTYSALDMFYQDYMPPDRKYIRVDEYHKRHKMDKYGRVRDKNGRIIKKSAAKESLSETERRRANDRSLMTAMKAMKASGQPAIGVCRPIDGLFGYQAGVIFDEEVAKRMHHSDKGNGFTEWDIVEDFLWGVHGNEDVYTTTPSAGWVLYEYVSSYKPRLDMHYKSALRKYRNKY
jgi:hypothetical protein